MSAFDTEHQVNTWRAGACQGKRRIETPEPDEHGVKLWSTREGKETCAPRHGDQAGSVRLPKFSSRSSAYAGKTAKKIPPKPKTRSCEAVGTAQAHPYPLVSNGPHSQACRPRDAALR